MGIGVVNNVDAAVVERSGGVSFINPVVGEVHGIGVHDSGKAIRQGGLSPGRVHDRPETAIVSDGVTQLEGVQGQNAERAARGRSLKTRSAPGEQDAFE